MFIGVAFTVGGSPAMVMATSSAKPAVRATVTVAVIDLPGWTSAASNLALSANGGRPLTATARRVSYSGGTTGSVAVIALAIRRKVATRVTGFMLIVALATIKNGCGPIATLSATVIVSVPDGPGF